MRAQSPPNRREQQLPAVAPATRPSTRRPRIWPRALLLGLIAAVPYLTVAGGLSCDYRQTLVAYHIYVADAMLHGQLHLREPILEKHFDRSVYAARYAAERQQRASGQRWSSEQLNQYLRLSIFHDLAITGNRVYAYWAPLTPALTIPWVAVFGPEVSDRFINAVYGAVNIALAYWMFRSVDRSGLRRISEPCCLALTVVMAFGTVHFWLSSGGKVWFAVQICTLMPLLLSMIALTAKRNSPGMYAMSGALFGAAFLGRNIVAAAGLFFIVVIWLRQRDRQNPPLRGFLIRVIAFGVPLAAAAALQLAYNYARFGSIWEAGQAITVHTGGEPRFVADFDRYGSLNPVYLAKNLYYYFWNWHFPVRDGRRAFDPEGNSMFLITPPLLYLFLAWRQRDGFTLALLCGVAPLLMALLLFRATGYFQFGNRYLLDAMPLLLLLVATGMRGRMSLIAGILTIAAVAMNIYGTVAFFFAPTADLAKRLTLEHVAVGAAVVVLLWILAWTAIPQVRRHVGALA